MDKPWHTLPGETNKKDARMEMTQDNFYRVIGLHDELITEQKNEISSLKYKVNRLEQKVTKGKGLQDALNLADELHFDECADLKTTIAELKRELLIKNRN